MSPYAKGRRWSPPLVILALLLSALGFAPAAQAEEPVTDWYDQYLTLPYDCLEGQTVKLDPGQAEVIVKDADGNKTGNVQIVAATLYVFPIEQFGYEGRRVQEQLYPGTVTTFQPETGLPQNEHKMLWTMLRVEWSNKAGWPEFQPAQVTCEGEGTGGPADTDGDGVVDAEDNCPNTAGGGASDGCPSGVSLSVDSVQPHNTTTGALGSATIKVTNVADSQGRTETYTVTYEQQSREVTLGDGDSDFVTFTGPGGSWNVCAKSTTRVASTCITATVPSYTAPQYAGKVVYEQLCTGLRYTITNTGDTPLIASVMLTHYGNSLGTVTELSLAPGASRTLVTPRYYNATVSPTLRSVSPGMWQQALPVKRWVVPPACSVWMIGGTKLVKWGPQLTKRNGYPWAVVSTRAYSTWVGYQVKGSPRVHWVMSYGSQGNHRFDRFLKVRRGKQVTIRLWVVYSDATGYVRYGKAAFTPWKTFRRP